MYLLESDHSKEVTDGNQHLHNVFSTYVGITICILGLIGNTISVLVWKRLNKKRHDSGKSAGIFLIALAITDSGLLIFFLLTESFQGLQTAENYSHGYITFYCYVGFPMYFFSIVASIWMVISITYNRFVAVMFPHKTASLNTVGKSYVIICGTLFFSFAINMPHFFFFRPTFNEQGKWVAKKTDFGKTHNAVMYDFWGHCMLLVLIPWILITILNFLIICRLYHNRTKRTETKKVKFSKEHQTTVILLTVSFTFLLFLIWQCITQCFFMLHYKSGDKKVWFDISSAYAPARLGVILNSAVNFILYCLTGQMFRKEMYRMFAELFGCNNYLVLLDTSTTVSNTVSRSSMNSFKNESKVVNTNVRSSTSS